MEQPNVIPFPQPLGASYVNMMSRVPLGLLPTTPVPFGGTTLQPGDPIIAWGRLLLYGTVSYLTWRKYRTISYIAMGAAGISMATSLSATAWGK